MPRKRNVAKQSEQSQPANISVSDSSVLNSSMESQKVEEISIRSLADNISTILTEVQSSFISLHDLRSSVKAIESRLGVLEGLYKELAVLAPRMSDIEKETNIVKNTISAIQKDNAQLSEKLNGVKESLTKV